MKGHLFFVTIVLFLFACKGQEMQVGEGILKGKISIGPLCPFETIPPGPECFPTAATYRAWQTAVYTPNRRKVADLVPDSTGNYGIALASGMYIIDFAQSRTGGIGSDNLPAEIQITAKDTTLFNIKIDTGIR